MVFVLFAKKRAVVEFLKVITAGIITVKFAQQEIEQGEFF